MHLVQLNGFLYARVKDNALVQPILGTAQN